MSGRAWGLNLGVGTLVTNFMSAQSGKDGGRKKLELAPTLLIAGNIHLWAEQYLTPRFAYSTYFNEHDSTSKSNILLSYHMSTKFHETFMLHYGFSTFITKIGGKGGTVDLPNGDSTATFYVPEESRRTYTSSLDVGGEFLSNQHWSVRGDLMISRFLSDRRKLNYLLTGNFYF